VALLRVFVIGCGGAEWDWRPIIWAVALLTMIIGTLVAIAQTDVKRMLAYSAVAHSGFILVGVAGAYVGVSEGTRITSTTGVLFYLVAYGLGSFGAFALGTLIRD